MNEELLSRLSLHHIGIIVHNLDSAIESYRNLGFGEPERFRVEDQNVEVATFHSGAGYVELISPTVSEGGLVRYLETRGESIHHVAYRVNDIQCELNRLRDAGFELIDETPRVGSHNWLVAFVHPKSCHGVLTELVQVPDER
jgi:methylmalonyl-CoA/ethylmalonyl-CoA epimerase